MNSTLITTVEYQDSEITERTSNFPSRIVNPDKPLSAVFSGVMPENIFSQPKIGEYRFLWKIVPESEAKEESPKEIFLPLKKEVTLTYSQGSSSFLSLAVGGVNVTLNFDIPSRVLYTSWFTPQFTTSWSIPRFIKPIATMMIENAIKTKTTSLWDLICCRRASFD